ncbi:MULTISPECIES: chorismate-binding protein [Mesonia]|uniref:Isochorismate synthase EntC n=1 Tax=Mesonia oceanica TaxID=2687242 RepID=A0AC61Y663_9FLAO|nr:MULTISPECIES: chorismate-binding protein [Mesonia]MAN28294.1 isochorismate synthase [Mesonia sp.]MAQ39758.1 isochorismate synthase [Mesonia sp.]VVU99882.1 Isochorismate synthase EntC [Mesonia oceanica]|tara:strand:+ start:1507 stop:2634 length:1128 start_codon:yes stop_codon:yes gene_type:complete
MTLPEYFQQLEKQLEAQLPFVAYRHPNSDEFQCQLQQKATLEYLENFQQEGFVFAPFDNQKRTIFFNRKDAVFSKLKCTAEDLVIEEETNTTKEFENSLQQKAFHENIVAKGIETIENSALEKVVLSRKQVLVVKTAPIEYFKRLLKTYPAAFVYCWYHPQVGLWLAATPETLVKTQNNRFKTMALAGTQVFKETAEIAWGEKEKEEQAIVTRTIENALKSIKGIENLQISEVQTHRAGNVVHLKTDITGVFQKDSLEEIVTNLHPTPAVCGLPKEMAKTFILKEEHYDRAFYSGYVGELNIQVEKPRNPRKRNVENSAFNLIERQSNLYVNLRCMQLLENKALLYIGGGITKDSNPTAEWEETLRKAETMQNVL